MREPLQGEIPEFLVMEIKLPGIVCVYVCVCVCVCVCICVCYSVCVGEGCVW